MRFTALSPAPGFPAVHRTATWCAIWGLTVSCAVAGNAAESPAGRRTAEALPPGRFRTALLAELAVLDARRAPGAAVAPPTPETAAVEGPAAAGGPFRPPGWVDPFGEGMEEEADRALNRETNRAASRAVVRPVSAATPAPGAVSESIRERRSLSVPDAPGARDAEPAHASENRPDAPAEPPPAVTAPSAATTAPAHTPGFGPYCPVSLRDERRLVKADAATTATIGGLPWHFATPEARDAFQADPRRYRPVDEGRDVVLRELEGFRVPGRPDRCVIYRDRLYLFASARSRAAFVKDPKRFARP